jgi:Caspase domain
MICFRFRVLAIAAITLTWAVLVAPVPAADAPGPRPRAALVIGDADYTTLNSVPSAANDEHDMCEALTGLGYGVSCFADVKDTREFRARIQDFTSALKPKSEVVFYYAGHAVNVKGENYLLPAAASLRTDADVPKEAISLSYIMAQLLQGKHYLNIVILDVCRGPPWSTTAHNISAGIAPITAIPRGTMVMYATAPTDYAELDTARNGVFTRHLLANITSPGLSADDLFKKVSEGVQSDAGDASAGVQSPALYTNFTGEFCFGGCVDKVARAELERIEKENEEQLEETRKQRAALEARQREAQAKLVDAAISTNCGANALGDTGRCFSATPQIIRKAIATAFIQRGFMFSGGSATVSQGGAEDWWTQAADHHTGDNQIEAVRISDDPTNKNVSETVTVSATLRNVESISRCIVTLGGSRHSVLHDEFHTWGTIGIVPVTTSKQYRDVVKNDVTITDSAFYQDLFAAIERNVHGINAVAAQTPEAAAATSEPDPAGLSDHVRRYDAPPDRTLRSLIEALVTQGYLVRSPDPELGAIRAYRSVLDPKDKHGSINSRLIASVTTPEDGVGSQAQLATDDTLVLHEESGGTAFSIMSGDVDEFTRHERTRIVHDAAVTDAGFYRSLFAATDAILHGSAAASKHSRRAVLPLDQAILTAIHALSDHGYQVRSSDEKLGLLLIYRRSAVPLKSNDGWIANYVNATVYVKEGMANDSVAYVAATSQEGMYRALGQLKDVGWTGMSYKSAAPRDCRVKKKCTVDELEERFAGSEDASVGRESVTSESDADQSVYNEILSIVSQSAR